MTAHEQTNELNKRLAKLPKASRLCRAFARVCVVKSVIPCMACSIATGPGRTRLLMSWACPGRGLAGQGSAEVGPARLVWGGLVWPKLAGAWLGLPN